MTLPFSARASPMAPGTSLYRAVDEAAGVDHHHFRIVIAGHHVVPFGTQLGQDALGIDQIFRQPKETNPTLGACFVLDIAQSLLGGS
jgi:hypothetical protein